MVKQGKPAIGDIVMNAFHGRVDLNASLASIKIETSDRPIPNDVALELHSLWLTILRQTRPPAKADRAHYIHPAKTILWAKEPDRAALSGKYPPDAAKQPLFTSVEAIVDDLIKSCDMPENERIRALRKTAERARHLRESLVSR